jgi:CelD/BcsL family acetyltransferase involved in cellulose biosynthesis
MAPLEREWDELADRVAAPPFLRPGWIGAWWSAYGIGRPTIFNARREDGRLSGVLPLYRSRGRFCSASNAHTPEFGVLAEDATTAGALCHALMEHRGRRISLSGLDPASAGVVISAAKAAGRATLVAIQQRSPYIRFEADRGGSPRRLRQKASADLRRRRRRLEETGRLTIEIEDGTARLDELLEEGFRIEGSGWKDARGTAIRSHENTRRHYTEVARWAARRGWLRLTFLRLDGEAVAFQFALDDGRSYYFLKGGFAREHARSAPGRLLVQFMLDYASSKGLETFEFLGAAEPWKLEWTATVRERVLVEAFTRSPAGLLEWAARTLLVQGRLLAKRRLVGAR